VNCAELTDEIGPLLYSRKTETLAMFAAGQKRSSNLNTSSVVADSTGGCQKSRRESNGPGGNAAANNKLIRVMESLEAARTISQLVADAIDGKAVGQMTPT
jgi:hypothetical protein